MTRLDHKIAVVTGGGTGIGRAICIELAREGAAVVVAGNVEAQANAVAREVRDLGRKSLACVVDVTDSSQVNRMAEAVDKEFGRTDVIVTCAGVMGARSLITQTSDAAWRNTIEVNLNASFYCIKAFLPGMLERNGGRIITISSTSGKLPAAMNADYAASKHGVIGLTKALALELGILGKNGITANAICPGSVDTPMIDAIAAQLVQDDESRTKTVKDRIASRSIQRRLLDPEEIAHMAVYLASDQARGITGQAINVCAGTVLF
jgi:NAD(P)-dependent dehydrogenase (short-subunit alcohol dehydrogenase family)